jgi:hypothetical protein
MTMPQSSEQLYPLASLSELDLLNVKADLVTYKGRRALRLIENEIDPESNKHSIAILTGSDFQDGVIETEVAGAPLSDAPEYARGFVGIAFRVQPMGTRFEYFFLRPANGRAADQLRRNHSTQYASHPDHPWFRLREESPGFYESYVDLVPGEWTKVKIVVSGIKAQLFVNGAEQPCLIVNDLKLGEARGGIALWIGGGTEAHFSEINVTNLNVQV